MLVLAPSSLDLAEQPSFHFPSLKLGRRSHLRDHIDARMMFLAKKIRPTVKNVTVVEGPSLHATAQEFVQFRDSLQPTSIGRKSTV